jgi:hypothetical protein
VHLLIYIVFTLIVVGLLLYLINFLPLAAPIPQLIRVVVIIFAVLWVISLVLPGLGGLGGAHGGFNPCR